MRERQKQHLVVDALAVAASIVFSIWLVRSGMLDSLLVYANGIGYLESVAAGIFFTSAFTTAPAIVVLGEIAQHSSLFLVAFWGAIGALVGDLLLFRFISDRVSEDLMALLGKRGEGRLYHIVERRLFRWFSPLIAALIIASPLPDELGVMFLGFAKTRTLLFVLFSFVANFAGILVICLIAQAAR